MKYGRFFRIGKILIVWIGLVLSQQNLFATPDRNETYRAISVTGRVLVRSSLGSQWIEVKAGMMMSEGQLLQVWPDSKVQIELKSNKQFENNSLAGNVLLVTQASTFRLNPALLRKVNVSRYVLKNMSQIARPDDYSEERNSHLDEAWDLVSAVLFQDDLDKKRYQSADIQELENRGLAMGHSSKPIDIVSPAGNSIFQVETFPVELPIFWNHVAGPGMKYNIYCWDVREKQPIFQGSTKDNQYNLSFLSPGSYFFQIMSSDFNWQSTAAVVHLEHKTMGSEDSQSKSPVVTMPSKKFITLKYPLPQLRYITKEAAARMEFQWQMLRMIEPIGLELLLDGPQKPQRRIALPLLTQGSFPVDLSKGQYSWAIAVKWKEADKLLESTSATQTFYVQANEADFQSIILNELKNPQLSGTLYLESGF
jgi:hypothetical protein